MQLRGEGLEPVDDRFVVPGDEDGNERDEECNNVVPCIRCDMGE